MTVVSGDGVTHTAGSHASKPLQVSVTDETGRPVEGARVSFQIPEEGPGGLFPNGLRTDLAISDAGGHATLRGLQLNRTAGGFNIRVTAVKDQSRAGILVRQSIGGGKALAEGKATQEAKPVTKAKEAAALAQAAPPVQSAPAPQPVPSAAEGKTAALTAAAGTAPPGQAPQPSVAPAKSKRTEVRVIVEATAQKPRPVAAPQQAATLASKPKPAAGKVESRSRVAPASGPPAAKETKANDPAVTAAEPETQASRTQSTTAASGRPGPVPTIVLTQRQSSSGSNALSGGKSHKKWILVGILAAGGAAGAFAGSNMGAFGSHGSTGAAVAASAVSIGVPTVNVGHP